MITLQIGLFRGSGRLTQLFGANPQDYAKFGLRGHNGIDYAINTGTDLFSCLNGVVIEAQNDRYGYGDYIKIENDSCGVIYAHLDKILVSVGNKITAGQVIGKSGNTGNSTGPHLHFGVFPKPRNRQNGFAGYINPLDGTLINWVEKINEDAVVGCKPDKKLPDTFYSINQFIELNKRGYLTNGDAYDVTLDKFILLDDICKDTSKKLEEEKKKVLDLKKENEVLKEKCNANLDQYSAWELFKAILRKE